MTSLEFDALNEGQQLNFLRAFGVLVAERIVGENRFYLYAISSFYVELFHDLSRSGTIMILRSFSDVKLLDSYLSNVDITSLQRPN